MAPTDGVAQINIAGVLAVPIVRVTRNIWTAAMVTTVLLRVLDDVPVSPISPAAPVATQLVRPLFLEWAKLGCAQTQYSLRVEA
jgi:hypothetical protein